MTAYFANEQTVLFSPDHLSRRGEASVRPAGLGAWISRLVRPAAAYVRGMLDRRAVLRDLARLSDRELADIGLTRSELRRVFDPGLTPRRGA